MTQFEHPWAAPTNGPGVPRTPAAEAIHALEHELAECRRVARQELALADERLREHAYRADRVARVAADLRHNAAERDCAAPNLLKSIAARIEGALNA